MEACSLSLPGQTSTGGEETGQRRGRRQARCNCRQSLGFSLTLWGALDYKLWLRVSPHWRCGSWAFILLQAVTGAGLPGGGGLWGLGFFDPTDKALGLFSEETSQVWADGGDCTVEERVGG